MLDAAQQRECADASHQLWLDAAKFFSLCLAGPASCVEKAVSCGTRCINALREDGLTWRFPEENVEVIRAGEERASDMFVEEGRWCIGGHM